MPEKAVAALQPVIAAAAGSKMYLAQYVMGASLAQQGLYPQAIERLRRAIELQPESAWAHYQMGSSLLQSGDYKTAIVHLEIASSRLPDFAAAHSLCWRRPTIAWVAPTMRSASERGPRR